MCAFGAAACVSKCHAHSHSIRSTATGGCQQRQRRGEQHTRPLPYLYHTYTIPLPSRVVCVYCKHGMTCGITMHGGSQVLPCFLGRVYLRTQRKRALKSVPTHTGKEGLEVSIYAHREGGGGEREGGVYSRAWFDTCVRFGHDRYRCGRNRGVADTGAGGHLPGKESLFQRSPVPARPWTCSTDVYLSIVM